MLRRAAFVLSTLFAALVVPLAGTSHAAACAAVAEPPHLVPGGYRLQATGTYQCSAAATGMTITVCIEELRSQIGVKQTWAVEGCATRTGGVESTDAISATAYANVMVYSTFLRTTVTGTNDRGETVTFATPPVLWFNCACSIF